MIRLSGFMKQFASAVAACALLVAPRAHGYCRTTTCAALPEGCTLDAARCPMNGRPVAWAKSEIRLYVDARGSELQGISAETTRDLTEEAVADWLASDCSGVPPTIRVAPVQLLTPELASQMDADFARYDGLNVITFQDDFWPHDDNSHAVGLTTVTYTVETGRILDTDIEINTFNNMFSVGDSGELRFDLLGLLKHEVGHVFGLNDLWRPGPTMYGRYFAGGIEARSLEADDRAGLCAIYVADRYESQGGFSCAAVRGGRSDVSSAFWLFALLVPWSRRWGRFHSAP